MAVSVREFDPKIALAALMYLVREASNDLYRVMKMLYVADKLHLEKTGRFMAGDDYIAMEQGATPSGAYDIVKYVRGDHQLHRGMPEASSFFSVEDRTSIILRRGVPEDDISPVAMECLNLVAEKYREHPNWQYWYQEAHDPAWQASLDEGALAPPMSKQSIAQAIPDNEDLLAYLADPYPEVVEG